MAMPKSSGKVGKTDDSH